MNSRRRAGVLAASSILLAAALAPPASAAPAEVQVRVEGADRTVVPRTTVTTTTDPVVKDGTNACSGTSALGALEQATDGDWGGSWASFGGYLVERVRDETHTSVSGATAGTFWSFWLNDRASSVGLCDAELQDGDEVLLFPDCFGADCVSPAPLRLDAPARAVPGRRFAVRVRQITTSFAADGTATTAVRPAAGAVVEAGGRTFRTGARGVARIRATGESVDVRAEKDGFVRSATETVCLAARGEDRCDARDTGLPVARITSVRPRTYAAERAPRRLAGEVEVAGAGLRAVRLRLIRRTGEGCRYWSGTAERFRGMRCGSSGRDFEVGDRARWSYLLPTALGPGRYVLDVVAIDADGARSRIVRDRSRVVFRVR